MQIIDNSPVEIVQVVPAQKEVASFYFGFRSLPDGFDFSREHFDFFYKLFPFFQKP